jgi:hypothetical protein
MPSQAVGCRGAIILPLVLAAPLVLTPPTPAFARSTSNDLRPAGANPSEQAAVVHRLRPRQAGPRARQGLADTAARAAVSPLAGETIRINRGQGRIVVDGVLDDEGWKTATRVETWYETNPGDNTDPPVKSVGYLAYDERYFYAAFDFFDPDPRAIRSPYADHDHIDGNSTDYGGVILDTRNDGHSAVLLLASATGSQYDAVTDDDGSGEDSSPDFFWESAARITDHGWTLEMRVPFSSLRYRNVDPQTWGILLYRNYPRTYRYQFFSARLPRGGNCFICRANTLMGLEGLPSGGHVVGAPYVTAAQTAQPTGAPGTPLASDGIASRVGADLKWTPTADNAVDLTLKPDFSQIEADTAQISANERFALSFPEKRPFFLEGVELLSTPFKAVYTRTITAPRWGVRATGKARGFSYTMLVADDGGGGSVIVPGPNDSSAVDQPSGSTVVVGRMKRSFGRHFVGLLVTDREGHDGSGFNRVFGPDFQWRASGDDVVTGQWLVSDTRTPQRPDLTAAWTGESLAGSAGTLQWSRNKRHLDLSAGYKDVADRFRADTGFIPQVGYRETSAGGGWTIRPRGLITRQRTFVSLERQVDHDGALISRTAALGGGMDTRLNGFLQFRYLDDRIRSGGQTFPRRRFGYVAQFSPSRMVARVAIDGTAGEEIDFDNARSGRGTTINASATLNPSDHIELQVLQNRRSVRVAPGARFARLFTARVSRVRATYTFTSQLFVRVIGQYVATDRDPALYRSAVSARSGEFSGSALLAYKLNWQSVLFIGYGDDRELTEANRLERADRQVFVKLSYAFQR